MTLDGLVPVGARAIRLYDAALADPRWGPALRAAVFLFGISGAFWFASQVLSAAALKVHDALDHSLAALFAVSYNLALAVLFGAVMAAAVFRQAAGSALLLGYQAAAFVLVYFVLSAAYSDASGVVDEYAVVGYVGGLAAFLLCCVRTEWLSHPAVLRAHAFVSWVYHGWPGKVAAAVSVAEGGLYAARHARKKLFWRRVKLGGRRFFFA